MGAPARRFPLAAGAVPNVTSGTLRGFTVRETVGAVAAVRIHAGSSANGVLLAAISLPANGSQTAGIPDGVAFTGDGVFVEIVSGTVEGSLFIA